MTVIVEGDAAPGWPASGAVVDEDRLFITSRNLDATRVAEIDVQTMSVVRQRLLPAGEGAWGLTVAPDGVYVGLFGARGAANLFRLTPTGSVAVAALDVDYIWELTAAPPAQGDDRVYGVGDGPSSLVFAHDPATGRSRHHVGLSPGQRPRTCLRVGGRLVVGGRQTGGAFLIDTTAPAPGAVRNILPPALADDVTIYCSAATADGRIVVGTGGPRLDRAAIAIIDPGAPGTASIVRLPREATVDTVTVSGDVIYATARPSGGLYRLASDGLTLSRVDVPVAMSETRRTAPVPGGVLGVSADGSVWRHDLGEDRSAVSRPVDLGLDLRPQLAQVIGVAPDHVDVGGSFSITRHSRRSSAVQTRFLPGEAKAMVEVDGDTFMAIYPIGEIWRWDAGAVQPRRVTQLQSDQLRPVALAYLDRLDALVCTTTDDASRSLLHVIDPETGRIDVTVNPLGPQAVSGLATDGKTIFVGGSGSSPAVAAFDAVGGRLMWRVSDVVRDGGFVLGLAVVGRHLVVSTTRGWITAIDLATRQVATPVRPASIAGQLRTVGSSAILTTGDQLIRIRPAPLSWTVIEGGLDAAHWNWPPMDVDAEGRVWCLSGRSLART